MGYKGNYLCFSQIIYLEQNIENCKNNATVNNSGFGNWRAVFLKHDM